MKQYHELLKTIQSEGDKHTDRTGVGTQSIFGYQMRFNLADGFPLMTTKRLSFKIIAEELFWFLSGSTNNERLREREDAAGKPIKIWDAWSSKEQTEKFGRLKNELGPVYGHQWRNWNASFSDEAHNEHYHELYQKYVGPHYDNNGYDQIKALCNDLVSSRGSRRLIVSGWHPVEATQVALPPCHTLFQLKWHETTNKLDLQLYQRSADVFLGVPYNIASYALLLHLLAHTHSMLPGIFIHTFGDVHIYNTHPDAVNEQLARVPRALPTLEIADQMSGTGFDGLMRMGTQHLNLKNYNPDPSIKAEVAV